MIGPMYRVTEAGREAWQSKDLSVPSDYRTMLWVMDFQGSDHLTSLAGMFPEQLISDCLVEMAELGLLEHLPLEGGAAGSASAGHARAEPILYSVAAGDVAAVRHTLSSRGAYLSEVRLNGRRRSAKSAADTTILIVEDDPDQLALADLRVSMAGYAVRVAKSQTAMLKSMADKGAPDLMLLDVMLPDGDGFDILEKLRRLPSFIPLPIVLLTAKTDAIDILKGLTLGADGYITKPYSKSLVIDVIRRVLRTAPLQAC